MTDLPTPDPAAGQAAADKAEAARRDVSAQLSAGTMTLTELFEAVDAEDEHLIGHMHVRHALMALPRIGDLRADRVLAFAGISGDEHLDVLGDNQRALLKQGVEELALEVE